MILNLDGKMLSIVTENPYVYDLNGVSLLCASAPLKAKTQFAGLYLSLQELVSSDEGPCHHDSLPFKGNRGESPSHHLSDSGLRISLHAHGRWLWEGHPLLVHSNAQNAPPDKSSLLATRRSSQEPPLECVP